MRRLTRACASGLLIGGLGALLALSPAGATLEERLGLGWLFRLRGALPPPAEAVVVRLDPDAAAELGLPEKTSAWPRTVHARLIERLAAAGASVIVFDVAFAEPRAAAEDEALAQAIAATGRVVLLEYLYQRFHDLPDLDFRHNERAALGVDDSKRAEKALVGIVGKRMTYRQPNG